MSSHDPSNSQSIYEQERRAKLQKLRDLGIDPFGQRTDGLASLASIKEQYKPEMGHDQGPQVKGAGRIMLKRDMGKLSFLTLRDESGDLQVAIDKRRVSERDWEVRNNLDLGDIIAVEGALGSTNKGETTIWASGLSPAGKSLLVPPSKHEGLTDVEARYRQRYVDLWANPDVMRVLKLRIRIVEEIRTYLKSKGYTEVETPMLQPIHGGAAARPFVTHHNALDMRLYLRIAPELYLKRLLVGGFNKVFEINRNFRNEGISPRHNPEFTMLEAYEAFGSFETMADMVEEMVTTVAMNVFGTLKIEHRNDAGETTKTINLERPWRRVSMVDLVEEWFRTTLSLQYRFDKRPIQDSRPEVLNALDAYLVNKARKHYTEGINEMISVLGKLQKFSSGLVAGLLTKSPPEQLAELYEKLIEPTLIHPTFVTHVPGVIIPLARKNRDDPFYADVYELAINGQEISPGYSELNDPDVQADNFRNQVGDREEQQHVDEDFLTALKYGMPPAGGMGLGIDRLVMMLTGAESIRDVILFPLMRPEA